MGWNHQLVDLARDHETNCLTWALCQIMVSNWFLEEMYVYKSYHIQLLYPPWKLTNADPEKGQTQQKEKKKRACRNRHFSGGHSLVFTGVSLLSWHLLHTSRSIARLSPPPRRGPKESRVEIREVETIFYQQKREGKIWTLASGFRKRGKFTIRYDKWIWDALLEMIRNPSPL